jgi:hypothetical protein
LGRAAPGAPRLSNRIHSFFVETGGQIDGFVPESGLTIDLVKPADLRRMILAGEFVLQLHLGTLLLAQMHSLLMLE